MEVRSVYRGRVRWAFPHRVVFDDGERFGLYLAPGAEGVWMGRDPDGRYLELRLLVRAALGAGRRA